MALTAKYENIYAIPKKKKNSVSKKQREAKEIDFLSSLPNITNKQRKRLNRLLKKKSNRHKAPRRKEVTWITLASKEYLSDLKTRRKERLKVATPRWESDENIKDFYKKAKVLGMSVDHIIPLLGDWQGVCGLHCIDNFQMMPLKENIDKGSNYQRDW